MKHQLWILMFLMTSMAGPVCAQDIASEYVGTWICKPVFVNAAGTGVMERKIWIHKRHKDLYAQYSFVKKSRVAKGGDGARRLMKTVTTEYASFKIESEEGFIVLEVPESPRKLKLRLVRTEEGVCLQDMDSPKDQSLSEYGRFKKVEANKPLEKP